MNIRKRTLLAAVAVLLLLTQLCACSSKSDEELIRDRIENFMSDYNDGDLDAALENLTPKTRNATQAILNMAESLGGLFGLDGISLSDMFSLGLAFSDDEMLKVTVQSVTIQDEENATAETELSLNSPVGDAAYSIRFVMQKKDGDWYIDNLLQQ